jgi:uncharacterized Zn finger protein
MSEPNEPAVPPEDTARAHLASAQIYCESCRRETAHRVLRVLPGRPRGGAVRGIARCRECRLTHPFESVPEATVPVKVVLSEHDRSTRSTLPLPRHRRLLVGSGLPSMDPSVRVRRIDLHRGGQAPDARTEEIATLWATREPPPSVKVSIVIGRLTRTTRLPYSPGTRFEVGAPVVVENRPLWIAAVRARGHTWRMRGDVFPAEEVERIYVRRTEMPPAGSRDWSSERDTPSDSARLRSTDARSRSSPGRRTARTSPRVRTADSGAAVHRVPPSCRTVPTAISSGTSRTKFFVPWITQAPRGTNSPDAAAFDT